MRCSTEIRLLSTLSKRLDPKDSFKIYRDLDKNIKINKIDNTNR